MLKTISPIDNSLYLEIPYASESTIENTLTSSHKAKTTWKNTSLQERKKLIKKFPNHDAVRSPKDAAMTLLSQLLPGDNILIKGSRKLELEKVLPYLQQ